jgi:hypothetical protein
VNFHLTASRTQTEEGQSGPCCGSLAKTPRSLGRGGPRSLGLARPSLGKHGRVKDHYPRAVRIVVPVGFHIGTV